MDALPPAGPPPDRDRADTRSGNREPCAARDAAPLHLRLDQPGLDPEDVFECPACGGFSAFAPGVAELLEIPTVAACSAWEVTCGHCRTMFVERDAPIVAPLFGFPDELFT
jgi:hypothetical protein